MQTVFRTDKEFEEFKTWTLGVLHDENIKDLCVTFTKKDGTERVMECTTAPSLVPVDVTEEVHYTNTDSPVDFPKPKKERKVNEDVCPVYDLESKHWKSFRWDSIKSILIKI